MVWVIGHKNPDTDSICAAIAYANLKNQTDDDEFIPKKAGELNNETRYVLSRFGVEEPETVLHVGTQIKDLDFYHLDGVSGHISLKKAWELMKTESLATLSIVNERKLLEGVLVSSDIAYSYIDILDNTILGRARTQYKNILETLNGHLLTGNEHGYFVKGKVVVAAGSRASITEAIDEDDLVILGDAQDRQELALAKNPSCMIVTCSKEVDESIIKRAKELDCVLISTEYDSFTTARLIHQSMPIQYFMKRDDLVVFELDDYIDDVKSRISKVRHRDFPILDEERHYVGTFSRRHLLNMKKKRLILVDHNEKTQAVDGIDQAEILEIVDHHRLGSLETIQPIMFRNQPLGCCSTIIYQMYIEKGVEISPKIAGLLLSAILSDTLMFRSPTCTPRDEEVAKELAKIANVDYEELAIAMFEAGSDFNDKSTEDIIYQDFKTFSAEGRNFGVSQVSAISEKQLGEITPKLRDYLNQVLVDKNLDMVFVMLTNILEQGSDVISAGAESAAVLELSFGKDSLVNGVCRLPGVVSRKKQMIPKIIEGIQGLM